MKKVMNRKDWLQIIAISDKKMLKDLWQKTDITPEIKYLRTPEFGLLPLQGRINNSGDKFLFGDTTVTRAVVEIKNKSGYAFILGRDKEVATIAATIDALMQGEDHKARIMAEILVPLQKEAQQRADQMAQEVAPTKVDFFTMVRGE